MSIQTPNVTGKTAKYQLCGRAAAPTNRRHASRPRGDLPERTHFLQHRKQKTARAAQTLPKPRSEAPPDPTAETLTLSACPARPYGRNPWTTRLPATATIGPRTNGQANPITFRTHRARARPSPWAQKLWRLSPTLRTSRHCHQILATSSQLLGL